MSTGSPVFGSTVAVVPILAPLGLPGLHLKQDIFGVKLRKAGDAVLDSDTWMPR